MNELHIIIAALAVVTLATSIGLIVVGLRLRRLYDWLRESKITDENYWSKRYLFRGETLRDVEHLKYNYASKESFDALLKHLNLYQDRTPPSQTVIRSIPGKEKK